MFIQWVMEVCDRITSEAAEKDQGNPTIDLPRAPVAAGEVRAAGSRPVAPLENDRRTQTVLLVDDEPALLKAFCDLLSNNGFRVLTADSGKTAIAICQQHKGRIDILVSDVKMYPVDGIEVATRVRSTHPDIVNRVYVRNPSQIRTPEHRP